MTATRNTQAKKTKKTKRKRKTAPKKAAPPELTVDYVPLDELERWPRNPKLHDLPGIQSSIRRWGFTLPVMLDEGTRRLVAGHGRQEALSVMRDAGEDPPKNIKLAADGGWLVPVVRGNQFESEEEAERYLIADNRFVEIGGWDPEMLSEMLVGFDGPDLRSIGFDEEELARITRMAGEGQEPPEKFVSFTAKNVETNHECPKCGYKWNQ